MFKKTVLAALAAGAASIGFAAAAAPAQAALGECQANRFCLWFNSGYDGARADYAVTDGSMANELFNDGPAGRNGWGVQVEDNAASYANRTGGWVYIFEARNCQFVGDVGAIQAGAEGNLAAISLKNKVSSIQIPATGVSGCANVNSSGY